MSTSTTTGPKIGLGLAVIAGINAMVGASIFVNPAALAVSVGPAALITYAAVVASVIIMALGLARVAAYHQKEGAFYVYASSWGGHAAGVIALGSYLIGLCLAMALLTRLTALYLAPYAPGWSFTARGMTTLWSLVALNMAGATLTSAGQMVLVVLTFLPVFAIMALCLRHADINNLFPFMPYGPMSLFKAIKAVIFGFFGFETAAALYGVVDKPEKNVSRAIIIATVLVGLLYMSFIGSIFLGIPRSVFTAAEMPLAQALKTLTPHSGALADLIGLGIIVTIMGTLHSLIWSLAELLRASIRLIMPGHALSMATCAMIIGCLVTIAFVSVHDINRFFSFTALFLTTAYGMALAALFNPRMKQNGITKLLAISSMAVATFIFCFALYELLCAC